MQLQLRASGTWAAHILYSVIACGWPLVVPNYGQLSGWSWHFTVCLASVYTLLLLYLLTTGMGADVRIRGRRAISSRHRPPFERYKRTTISGWLPALIVLAVSSITSIWAIVTGTRVEKPEALYAAMVTYFALGALLPPLVYQIAKGLGLFKLPDLTAWYRALPPKIQRMVRPATTPCPHPAEAWRHLDGLPQVIRRLALHEVIFRGESEQSLLASATALLTWRLAAILFPLIALFALPFLLSSCGLWGSELNLPLTLAIINWAAMALSYYVYAGDQGTTQEQRRLQWRRHLNLCRALGLRPERVITPDIAPFFGSSGVRSAIFLFTVMVPIYLGLIDIVP